MISGCFQWRRARPTHQGALLSQEPSSRLISAMRLVIIAAFLLLLSFGSNSPAGAALRALPLRDKRVRKIFTSK